MRSFPAVKPVAAADEIVRRTTDDHGMLLRGSDMLQLRDRPAHAQLDPPESYLTDGERLFRVVEPFTISESDAHVFMSLEDCMTLEVQSYSPQQLYGMRLRRVGAVGSRQA